MKKNILFLCIGIILFVFSSLTAIKTQIKQQSFERTTGLISELKTDPTDAQKSYLVVTFDTPDGRHFNFTSTHSYPKQKYRLNESIAVHYPFDAPEQANLGSVSIRWIGLLVLEFISLVTVIIFGARVLKQRMTQKSLQRLRTNGVEISTRPLRVELLYRNKKGAARCCIVSVWKNEDGIFQEFKTEAIEQEPETLLERYRHHTITVFMNPHNAQDYIVDMSFLS